MANRLPGLIQRFPTALLPLLSIKATEMPDGLIPDVAPSLEMLPFYVADRLETKTATQAAISAVVSQTITVPQGEYWVPFAICAIASNISAAGANVQLACGIATPDAASGTPDPTPLGAMVAPTVSIAGQTFYLPGTVPPGLILRPGSQVYAATLVDPGAQTLDLSVRVAVARLVTNG